MLGAIVLFTIVNAYEPQIDRQADLPEIMLSSAQLVTGIFGLSVAKRYWPSEIFGRAYLALGIGFILVGIGSTLFTVLQIFGFPNPYPSWPDLFITPYFFLVLFHLMLCTRYFKRKLNRRDKLVLIALPVCVNIIYIFAVLIPVEVPGSVPDLLSHQITVGDSNFKLVPIGNPSSSDSYQHITSGDVTYDLVPLNLTSTAYPQTPVTNSSVSLIPITFLHLKIGNPILPEQQSVYPFFAGVFYNTITTFNLAWAIIGAGVYRRSILGNAWGLLLVGIGLISTADIIYDFAISYYDRTNPDMAIWIFGNMIISYALYIHRKSL